MHYITARELRAWCIPIHAGINPDALIPIRHTGTGTISIAARFLKDEQSPGGWGYNGFACGSNQIIAKKRNSC